LPSNSKHANVNKFTVYVSPICSFVPPAIFESWPRLLRNQRGPVRIIRRRFTSSAKSPSFPRLSGLELFASISHLREVRKVKLFRLELKLPILIIVALHIHLHHDKIAIFTRTSYFYQRWIKFYLFNIVIVLKIVNEIIVNIFFSKIFFIFKIFWKANFILLKNILMICIFWYIVIEHY